MPFHTYMLHCSDGSYYTGHTDDLERRISQHHAGNLGGYTKSRRPVRLVWSQEYGERYEALRAERQIKGWSRAKKEALIDRRWDELSRLARSRSQFTLRQAQGERVSIFADVLEAMQSTAQAAHPREACGILLGEENSITRIIETRNVHPSPETYFEIDPQALIDAYRSAREGGLHVMGYFHSHPTGSPHPSETDKAMAAHDGKIWAIIADDDVMFWMDDKDGFHALSYDVGSG